MTATANTAAFRLDAHPQSALDRAAGEENPFADGPVPLESNESDSNDNDVGDDYDAYPDPPVDLPHDSDSDSDSDMSSVDGDEMNRSRGEFVGDKPHFSDSDMSSVDGDAMARSSGERAVGEQGPLHSSSSQTCPIARNIDNSALVYLPVRLRCGVLTQCRPEVLLRCPQVLNDLNDDLTICLRVLPKSVRGLVKKTQIWINLSYTYGPMDNPREVRHSTAHHHHGWLLWAKDKTEKVRSIEIYSASEFRRMRAHWNGAGLILHELCHLIHQLALPDGLDNITVKSLYHYARKSGLYDEVLRRDWAGLPCDTDMAYAMVNHKEWFAEMSVTFLADGYCDLDGASAATSIEACSPPLTSLAVIERMKKMFAQEQIDNDAPKNSISSCCASDSDQSISRLVGTEKKRLNFFGRLLLGRHRIHVRHCNKFFPFTRGQLIRYDPDVAEGIAALWQSIGCWDEDDGEEDCSSQLACWGWTG